MADPSEPIRSPRTLVLCFDGTSNEYDADNTNVVKLFALLKKNDDHQLCYYQPGIGTWFEPGVVSPLFEWCAKVLDLAFAWYLDAHILDGYKFLMQNYRAGDKICIFGFSRGAYTARALGGLLYKVGLLPSDNEQQVPFAYKMYLRTDAKGLELCAGFKQTYCRTINIDFMGVWETVSSVGVVMGRTLPFTNSNSSIRTFRHALALDEHRAKFRPNNYHRVPPNREAGLMDPEHVLGDANKSKKKRSNSSSSSSGDDSTKRSEKYHKWGLFGHASSTSVKVKKTGKAIAPELKENEIPDDVLEVWFSGCHSDVGGGAVANDTVNSLSNISLRWMVREAMASSCAIQFDEDALARAQLDLDPEPSETELDKDMIDALEQIHDELNIDPLWWLLEIIPLSYSWQDANGVWHRKWSFNLGKGRDIVDTQPKFHTTVQRRMQSTLGYTPKANWKKGSEVYVH